MVPDPALPATGVSLEWERLLSAIFVQSETYGTRAATVLIRNLDGRVVLEERGFNLRGEPEGVALLKA